MTRILIENCWANHQIFSNRTNPIDPYLQSRIRKLEHPCLNPPSSREYSPKRIVQPILGRQPASNPAHNAHEEASHVDYFSPVIVSSFEPSRSLECSSRKHRRRWLSYSIIWTLQRRRGAEVTGTSTHRRQNTGIQEEPEERVRGHEVYVFCEWEAIEG